MDLRTVLENSISHMNGVEGLKKIHGEASNRGFFRISFKNHSLVAMVYPQENRDETEKIVALTRLYQKHNINVPEIKHILQNRILLLEDLGNTSVQKFFLTAPKEKRLKLLEKITDILVKIKSIDPANTQLVLDSTRMKWEMDFFLKHFVSYFASPRIKTAKLKRRLDDLVDLIEPRNTFAHRDFHSRNMLVQKDTVYLVDFQDSLRANTYYDVVSFAYDSYLDLKSMRDIFFNNLNKKHINIDQEQLHLTAMQRNIKALGTFGFQVSVRKNLAYKKYISRTINHIKTNPVFDQFLDSSLFDFSLKGKKDDKNQITGMGE
jgi:aminoglycoside/choline kinase family phosphotransferase